jgi:NAD(P)H-dependent flavin oxidoreductase YrpB (nitropropane dioxygenase family)
LNLGDTVSDFLSLCRPEVLIAASLGAVHALASRSNSKPSGVRWSTAAVVVSQPAIDPTPSRDVESLHQLRDGGTVSDHRECGLQFVIAEHPAGGGHRHLLAAMVAHWQPPRRLIFAGFLGASSGKNRLV